jgi:hypothetical protein
MHALARRLGTAGCVAALFVATGCGGSDAGSDSPAGSAPSSTAPSSTAPSSTAPSSTAPNGGGITPTGTGDPFADAKTAAHHMPMTAAVLAQGFAKTAGVKGQTESKAADLRAGLTHMLTEHVYLAGIAVATAYTKGPKSPEFALATKTVDANSQDLAKAVGSVAGPQNQATFLQSWRSHINDFVAYAVAAKANDRAGKAKAVANLDAYRAASGQFFQKITGGAIPAKAVETSLKEHVDTLAKAVDGFAAGDPKAYDRLKAAADHMPMTAAALAAGIAKAAKIPGNSADPASELRSALTGALTSHVYLAGVAVFTAYTNKAGFEAAAGTLDKNSVEISKAVGSLAGAQAEKTFLQSWRQHITDFVGYANATAAKDTAGQQESLGNLQGYTVSAGELISATTKNALPAEAVTADLATHVASLAGAIDSLAKALVK